MRTGSKPLERVQNLRTRLRTRSKPLEREENLRTERKLLGRDKGNFSRELDKKEQTARKRLESLKARRKLFERD